MGRRAVVAALLALLAAACPSLSDDYEIVGTGASSGGGSGGAGATGGGGVGGGGGTSATGGIGGTTGGGGTAGVSGTGATGGTGGLGASGGIGGDASVDAADAGDAGCDGCEGACCSGACVDLDSNADHCGSCDNQCPAGRSCNFGKCGPVGWLAMSSTGGPTAREKAAYAWTGSQVFVFGGADATGQDLGDGGLYDPLTDTWSALELTGAPPSARVLATAVVLGNAVLVFGGGDAAGTNDYKDGAVYDLGTKIWTAIPDALKERRAPVAVWTGSRVLVWGGWTKSDQPITETHWYDPGASSWSVVSNSNEPSARTEFAWAASTDSLFVYAGRIAGTTKTDEAHRSSLVDGVWAAAGKGPSGRYGSFGAWDGLRFWVWGGRDDNNPKADGESYDGSTWTALVSAGAPSARWAPQRHTGWAARVADKVVVLAGGMTATGSYFTNGGLYDASGSSASWSSVASWPSGENHAWGVGVWTGKELVLWGGRTATSLTTKGERYLP